MNQKLKRSDTVHACRDIALQTPLCTERWSKPLSRKRWIETADPITCTRCLQAINEAHDHAIYANLDPFDYDHRSDLERRTIEIDHELVGMEPLFDLGGMPTEAVKKCADCGEIKPLTDFYRNKRSEDGRHYYCADCSRRREKEYLTRFRARPIEEQMELRSKKWLRLRLRQYGLTACEFARLRVESDDRCVLCGMRSEPMNIDHCHDTGRVRGLLCSPCNRSLGQLGDSPTRIERVLEYLKGKPITKALLRE